MQLKTIAKRPDSKLFNFKTTSTERAVLRKKAAKYAKGNVSAWIRYAATELEPRPTDLVRSQSKRA